MRRGDSDRWLAPEHGAEVFTAGLRRIENAARNIGGIEVINVCPRKPGVRGHGVLRLMLRTEKFGRKVTR